MTFIDIMLVALCACSAIAGGLAGYSVGYRHSTRHAILSTLPPQARVSARQRRHLRRAWRHRRADLKNVLGR